MEAEIDRVKSNLGGDERGHDNLLVSLAFGSQGCVEDELAALAAKAQLFANRRDCTETGETSFLRIVGRVKSVLVDGKVEEIIPEEFLFLEDFF
ncbi:hypothetical protein ACFLZ1_04315 [Patescibacteria group bacterium]